VSVAVSAASFTAKLQRLARDPCPLTRHHALLWPATGKVLMLACLDEPQPAGALQLGGFTQQLALIQPPQLTPAGEGDTPPPPPSFTKLAFRFRTQQAANQCFNMLAVRLPLLHHFCVPSYRPGGCPPGAPTKLLARLSLIPCLPHAHSG
jgi:hypothetical protein